MRHLTIAFAVIIIVVALGVLTLKKHLSAPISVACTMEAKICPDGSSVGRTGPNCEFAECPTVGAPTSTSTPITSGVNGNITTSPTCPVEHNPPDPACAPRPFSTLVTVFKSTDPVHAVVITRSDANGNFSIKLASGDYVIGAGESNLPRCPQTPVAISSNTYTKVNITCDTGIR